MDFIRVDSSALINYQEESKEPSGIDSQVCASECKEAALPTLQKSAYQKPVNRPFLDVFKAAQGHSVELTPQNAKKLFEKFNSQMNASIEIAPRNRLKITFTAKELMMYLFANLPVKFSLSLKGSLVKDLLFDDDAIEAHDIDLCFDCEITFDNAVLQFEDIKETVSKFFCHKAGIETKSRITLREVYKDYIKWNQMVGRCYTKEGNNFLLVALNGLDLSFVNRLDRRHIFDNDAISIQLDQYLHSQEKLTFCSFLKINRLLHLIRSRIIDASGVEDVHGDRFLLELTREMTRGYAVSSRKIVKTFQEQFQGTFSLFTVENYIDQHLKSDPERFLYIVNGLKLFPENEKLRRFLYDKLCELLGLQLSDAELETAIEIWEIEALLSQDESPFASYLENNHLLRPCVLKEGYLIPQWNIASKICKVLDRLSSLGKAKKNMLSGVTQIHRLIGSDSALNLYALIYSRISDWMSQPLPFPKDHVSTCLSVYQRLLLGGYLSEINHELQSKINSLAPQCQTRPAPIGFVERFADAWEGDQWAALNHNREDVWIGFMSQNPDAIINNGAKAKRYIQFHISNFAAIPSLQQPIYDQSAYNFALYGCKVFVITDASPKHLFYLLPLEMSHSLSREQIKTLFTQARFALIARGETTAVKILDALNFGRNCLVSSIIQHADSKLWIRYAQEVGSKKFVNQPDASHKWDEKIVKKCIELGEEVDQNIFWSSFHGLTMSKRLDFLIPLLKQQIISKDLLPAIVSEINCRAVKQPTLRRAWDTISSLSKQESLNALANDIYCCLKKKPDAPIGGSKKNPSNPFDTLLKDVLKKKNAIVSDLKPRHLLQFMQEARDRSLFEESCEHLFHQAEDVLFLYIQDGAELSTALCEFLVENIASLQPEKHMFLLKHVINLINQEKVKSDSLISLIVQTVFQDEKFRELHAEVFGILKFSKQNPLVVVFDNIYNFVKDKPGFIEQLSGLLTVYDQFMQWPTIEIRNERFFTLIDDLLALAEKDKEQIPKIVPTLQRLVYQLPTTPFDPQRKVVKKIKNGNIQENELVCPQKRYFNAVSNLRIILSELHQEEPLLELEKFLRTIMLIDPCPWFDREVFIRNYFDSLKYCVFKFIEKSDIAAYRAYLTMYLGVQSNDLLFIKKLSETLREQKDSSAILFVHSLSVFSDFYKKMNFLDEKPYIYHLSYMIEMFYNSIFIKQYDGWLYGVIEPILIKGNGFSDNVKIVLQYSLDQLISDVKKLNCPYTLAVTFEYFLLAKQSSFLKDEEKYKQELFDVLKLVCSNFDSEHSIIYKMLLIWAARNLKIFESLEGIELLHTIRTQSLERFNEMSFEEQSAVMMMDWEFSSMLEREKALHSLQAHMNLKPGLVETTCDLEDHEAFFESLVSSSYSVAFSLCPSLRHSDSALPLIYSVIRCRLAATNDVLKNRAFISLIRAVNKLKAQDSSEPESKED
ncbi:MAG: hypothetical protein WD595_01465 [Waddliaceae bacterium]